LFINKNPANFMMKQRILPFVIRTVPIKAVLVVITAFSIFIGICYGAFLFLPWKMADASVQVTIQRGMAPDHIAALLEKYRVIKNRKTFRIGAKFLGVSSRLQAGRYFFNGRQSNFKVLRKLTRGLVITETITIPEGTRASRIAKILHDRFNIDSNRFMEIVSDPSVCTRYGVKASSLEGYLYPDTYQFHLDPTPEEIVERLINRFWNIFGDSLRERAREMGLSIHQIVTLASIVEGEAVIDSERTVIAALYWNRLNRNMRLQADPTIQYIIRNGPRRLYKKDLAIDSPYNTYLHRGLPPGPVTNPGYASIYAVLYPASVNYLYMVANGDGSHSFSTSISGHLKAKKHLDQIRNDVWLQY
jgi:UPF0755 protein